MHALLRTIGGAVQGLGTRPNKRPPTQGQADPRRRHAPYGVVNHALVHHDHVGQDGGPEAVLHQRVLRQEELGHLEQRLFRPREKPINHGVGHQAGEVAAAPAQRFPAGGHGQHQVQVVAAAVHEKRPAVFFGVELARGLYRGPLGVGKRVLLVGLVQRGLASERGVGGRRGRRGGGNGHGGRGTRKGTVTKAVIAQTPR
jgi:hypothetical protein